MEKDYLDKNKDAWNKKTLFHVASEFYNMNAFLKGASSLNPIEQGLLGDVKGKSILHLQCHFGQDSLSLAREGAKVTGVDFSDKAIEKAREINITMGLDAEFVCCDIYNLKEHLNKKFDIVYTSYGTIGWLPDMERWAAIVAHFLKPGGKFVFVEFHPVVWMFDNEFSFIEYSYFNREAIEETESGTYAETNAPLMTETISWNHDLGEVIGSLLKAGLNIVDFKEYDYSPYECFKNLEETEPGKYKLKDLKDKIPMLYSLVANQVE